MKYEVVVLKDSAYSSEIQSLWVENKIFSEDKAKIHVKHATLGVKHTPTDKLVSVSTAKVKYNTYLRGYYYHYGVFSLPGYGDRPVLLPKTVNYLKSYRGNSIRGVAVVIKNPEITAKMLYRFGFNRPEDSLFTPPNLFYRDLV